MTNRKFLSRFSNYFLKKQIHPEIYNTSQINVREINISQCETFSNKQNLHLNNINNILKNQYFTRINKFDENKQLLIYDNDYHILLCIIKFRNDKLIIFSGPQFVFNISFLEKFLDSEKNEILEEVEDFIIDCNLNIFENMITIIRHNSLCMDITKIISYDEYYKFFENKIYGLIELANLIESVKLANSINQL